ncbi:c-type cytochrome [Spartinivicinus poritis]|uniref:Cytochrome c n=1 Tax=Spartinivicinus poritis TaxID=2994640 RepID=A0ABT5U564_9GAMM|nr:cytochrome c [Spartinivicinus sp. A2-2]MDE1460692.1 cytochrome c [Spartinivicinus sp. A2-2]
MQKSTSLLLKTLAIILMIPAQTLAKIDELTFSLANQPVKTISLDELKDKLKVHEIKFEDPHYGKTKHFLAFKIYDVLQLGFGDNWHSRDYSDAAFTASDGYSAISKVSMLSEQGGYLTFFDVDANGWEPVGHAKVSPGPFYLVWTGKQQTTEYAYPWTWQLASIKLIQFKNQYPAVYPTGISNNSTIYQGYQIFKGRCLHCHSINQQGGKIGPDLNAPQSIVKYRPKTMIKAYIKQPSQFRFSNMPDHLDLSEQQLDALIDYFQHKSKLN